MHSRRAATDYRPGRPHKGKLMPMRYVFRVSCGWWTMFLVHDGQTSCGIPHRLQAPPEKFPKPMIGMGKARHCDWTVT
jgi:hypothetical protein